MIVIRPARRLYDSSDESEKSDDDEQSATLTPPAKRPAVPTVTPPATRPAVPTVTPPAERPAVPTSQTIVAPPPMSLQTLRHHNIADRVSISTSPAQNFGHCK